MLIWLLGFGYHGDFMSGWDVDFLQEAIDTCTNPSGKIQDCPLFVDQGPLQDDDTQNSCTFDVPTPLVHENVLAANLKNLPGNIQIQSGPQSATPGAGNAAASIVSAATSFLGDMFGGATTTSSALSTSSASSTSLATSTSTGLVSALGGAFIESSMPSAAEATTPDFNVLASEAPPTPSSSISVSSSSAAAPTITSAPAVTSDPGVVYQIVSTQTITDGAQVKEIVWKEPVVYVTENSVTTVTVPEVKAAQRLRPRHAHHHGHHGRRS